LCCNAAPPQAEVKYLTWHGSMSSLSSSSRIPLGTTSKDETDDLTGNIFGGVYMNAGSHASTLDRLYAWERKLYDEVKVKVSFSSSVLFYGIYLMSGYIAGPTCLTIVSKYES
jgi:hypothetical protein